MHKIKKHKHESIRFKGTSANEAFQAFSSPLGYNEHLRCSDCYFWSWDDESYSGGHCNAFHKDGTWQSKACPFFVAKIVDSSSNKVSEADGRKG